MTRTKARKKLTRDELTAALAKAMNLLNDLDRDEWTSRQIGDWHELAAIMPLSAEYMNNGTIMPNEL